VIPLKTFLEAPVNWQLEFTFQNLESKHSIRTITWTH